MPDITDESLKPKHYALAPKTGYVYVSAVDTPAPPTYPFEPDGRDITFTWKDEADRLATAKWVSIGNTSLENGIEMSVEGDDPETLGTWQVPALEVTSPPKSYSMTVNLADISIETLKLYYGAGDSAVTKGQFVIPNTPTTTDKALYIIGTDGKHVVAWYYPSVRIIGADSITLDPSALTEVPVRASIVKGRAYLELDKDNKAVPNTAKDGLGRVFPKTRIRADV
ncbi:phage tail tube protein [Streptomyces vinaceus]|uniref:phage tail tube protein n=1 Tax=Streptomyces vinaceus TaxID=1960 RepID=UPI00369108F5